MIHIINERKNTDMLVFMLREWSVVFRLADSWSRAAATWTWCQL